MDGARVLWEVVRQNFAILALWVKLYSSTRALLPTTVVLLNTLPWVNSIANNKLLLLYQLKNTDVHIHAHTHPV